MALRATRHSGGARSGATGERQPGQGGAHHALSGGLDTANVDTRGMPQPVAVTWTGTDWSGESGGTAMPEAAGAEPGSTAVPVDAGRPRG